MLACATAGCAVRHPDPRVDLAQRAERAASRLEAMGPRLVRAGLDADTTVAGLAGVKQGIGELPAPAPPPPPERPAEPSPAIAADAGRWRLALGLEAMQPDIRISGEGQELHDNGPLMSGATVSCARLLPFDRHGGLRLGGELSSTWQFRQGGQYLGLTMLRPLIELAVGDLTFRPIIEIGQPVLRLGSDPGAITRADAAWGFGGRLGVRLGDCDLAVGWRRFAFLAHGEDTTYRIDGEGPEAALRWSF